MFLDIKGTMSVKSPILSVDAAKELLFKGMGERNRRFLAKSKVFYNPVGEIIWTSCFGSMVFPLVKGRFIVKDSAQRGVNIIYHVSLAFQFMVHILYLLLFIFLFSISMISLLFFIVLILVNCLLYGIDYKIQKTQLENFVRKQLKIED